MYLSLIFFLILIIPFVTMPKPIASGMIQPYRVVVGSVMIIATASVIIFMAASFLGDGLYAQMQDGIKAMAKILAADPNVIQMLKLQNADTEERLTLFTSVYSMAFQLLPACILASSAVVSYIAYILLSRSLSKRIPQVRRMPKFREFSLPPDAFTGLFLMYFAAGLLTLSGVFENDVFFQKCQLCI